MQLLFLLPSTIAAINEAVAVSAFTQFLGAIPSLYHAMATPHPYDPEATLVDYATMAVCMPVLLVGIKIGVAVNKMSPAWFVSWLMILVFIWSTIQCFFSYRRLRSKEVSKKNIIHKCVNIQHECADMPCRIMSILLLYLYDLFLSYNCSHV